MKRFYIIFLLFLTTQLYANSEKFNNYFISAASIAKPSVVNIVAYEKREKDGKIKLQRISYGTGTIISKSGFIVTNYHVVKKGDLFKAVSSDGITHELQLFQNGKYYLSDYKTDLAVLKLDNSDGKTFTPLRLADSNELNEGEWVIAIGNPYGLKQSITAGIVSSKGRDNIGFTDIEDFIQTDVSINPGNSGGPLVNLNGELVGINTAIRSASGGFQGISFAIPSNIVKHVCFDLTSFGRVKRGWLGFVAREKSFSQNKENKSVEVLSVIRNSPSDTAGIKQGDIIKEIDNEKIESLGALTKVIGNKGVGSRIEILLSRNGKIIDIKFVLREKDEYVRLQSELEQLFQSYGVEVDEDAITGNIVVTYLSPRSPHKEIEEGDIIVSVNNKKISSLESFIEKYKSSERKIQSIKVIRDSGTHEIYFEDIKNEE
ncbi:MAG TPA: trypsin-like peptidase domain-containing protein [Spirochaetota bacterium]|nr:trypsin-like peptidase domain-containing protein [Spirochaetota bacterium]